MLKNNYSKSIIKLNMLRFVARNLNNVYKFSEL